MNGVMVDSVFESDLDLRSDMLFVAHTTRYAHSNKETKDSVNRYHVEFELLALALRASTYATSINRYSAFLHAMMTCVFTPVR